LRLSERDARRIHRAVTEIFGAQARVWLFGSRTDDAARGGDIDLLVESAISADDRLEKTLQLEARLLRELGERRVDVLVRDPEMPLQPIHEKALEHGVPL